MTKRLVFLLSILTMIIKPVFAQVPDIGPSGCVAAYDAWWNVVECGITPSFVLLVLAVGVGLSIIIRLLKPKKLEVTQHQPLSVVKVHKAKKIGRIVKPTKVWGWGSFLVGAVSIGSIFYLLGHIVGPAAIALYFLQRRNHMTWPAIGGLVMGFVAFGYQVADWIVWINGYSWDGYYIMYGFIALLLLGLIAALPKRWIFLFFTKRKKKDKKTSVKHIMKN